MWSCKLLSTGHTYDHCTICLPKGSQDQHIFSSLLHAMVKQGHGCIFSANSMSSQPTVCCKTAWYYQWWNGMLKLPSTVHILQASILNDKSDFKPYFLIKCNSEKLANRCTDFLEAPRYEILSRKAATLLHCIMHQLLLLNIFVYVVAVESLNSVGWRCRLVTIHAIIIRMVKCVHAL